MTTLRLYVPNEHGVELFVRRGGGVLHSPRYAFNKADLLINLTHLVCFLRIEAFGAPSRWLHVSKPWTVALIPGCAHARTRRFLD